MKMRNAGRGGASRIGLGWWTSSRKAMSAGWRRRIGHRPVGRGVDRMGTIRFGSARYSVPRQPIEEDIELLVDGYELRVLHRGVRIGPSIDR